MADLKWWQSAVFYQIYPRSFADGNGDGIGDFAGMTAKLDYLRDLGINAIWLSPHFPSPFLDCGYDISDYVAVAPEYGTMDDFKTFLAEAHRREIKVVLDLVLNHSSDTHPWFVESRSSRDNPKRDWYVWRDGRDGGPPNNWACIFGGSAWELDATTGQYYYHAFLKEQPDLNWRNPEVKQAMWDAVRFWLDLGVDGYRLDAIGTVYEDDGIPDHALPLAPDDILDANALGRADYDELLRYQLMQPGIHELMRELRALVDEYPGDRVLAGEDHNVAFHGDDDELHLVFNFPLMWQPLQPRAIRANQDARLAELPTDAWPCNTLGNHDSPRLWSRFGDGVHDAALARLHVALMLTLRGTPFLYNGEEIGMRDLVLDTLDQFRDTAALRQYRLMVEKQGFTPADALRTVIATTRDRCRSPLQWSDAPNAGWCPPEVAPWLPVSPDYQTGVNVAAQEGDPLSLLSFYRQVIGVRRTSPALVGGDYQPLLPDDDALLAFMRESDAQRVVVVLNFTDEQRAASLDLGAGRLLFSSVMRPAAPVALDALVLAPFEVLIVEAA